MKRDVTGGVNLASRVFWGSSIGQAELALQLQAARDCTEGTVHLMHGVYACVVFLCIVTWALLVASAVADKN